MPLHRRLSFATQVHNFEQPNCTLSDEQCEREVANRHVSFARRSLPFCKLGLVMHCVIRKDGKEASLCTRLLWVLSSRRSAYHSEQKR